MLLQVPPYISYLPTNLMESPQALFARANNYEYSNNIPLRSWLRTLHVLLSHAQMYAREGDLQEAYILNLRFLDLVLNRIPNHPDWRSQRRKANEGKGSQHEFSQYNSICKSQVPQVLRECESLRNIIEQAYKDFTERSIVSENIPVKEEIHPQEDMLFDEKVLEKSLKDVIGSSDASKNDGGSHHGPSRPGSSSMLEITPQYPTIEPAKAPSVSSAADDVKHKTVNFTEGGSPLRTIFVPQELQSAFLKVSRRNTSKKLEMCGLLCGRLNRNAFFVTNLVIPQQENTENTCQTKNEEQLFSYIDSQDLFVLGWIHTHPTQSCFLSSVDLHTQNSYQIMLKEAIAIVAAPNFKDQCYGYFRLTDPPGVPTITSCRMTGFHPHEQKNLYVSCHRENDDIKRGHVVVRSHLPFEIKDLRK